MKLYKLTQQDNTTMNCTRWGPYVAHGGKAGVWKLYTCSGDVYHAYLHPAIAVLLNSRHARILNPKLWEAVGEPVVYDGIAKVGTRWLVTIKEIPLPVVTEKQQNALIRKLKPLCKQCLSWYGVEEVLQYVDSRTRALKIVREIFG